jgi:hypothetical protein
VRKPLLPPVADVSGLASQRGGGTLETLTARATKQHGIPLLLAALAASVLLVLQAAAITGSDGYSVYQVTKSIVEDADFSVPASAGVPGGDGEHYSRYGIGLSLLAMIPYVLAKPVARLLGHAEAVEQAAVASLIPIISALLVVALYTLARRLGGAVGVSVLISLGGVAGTFLLPYTNEFFGEPVVALFLVVAIERTLANSPGQAAAALAAGALVRPQAFLFAPILLLVLLWCGRVKALLRATPWLAGALAITLVYNHVRFGSITETGYEEGFTTPFHEGALGLLFNPTKSVFLFAPVMAIVPVAVSKLWRSGQQAAAVLIGGNLAVTFVTAATWNDWPGGWCWGPRLLIPGVAPALAMLAFWSADGRRRHLLTVALLALGFVVSAPAMVVSTRAQQLDVPAPSVGPSVIRQYELIVPTASYSVRHLGDRREDDHRRFLDVWQVGALRELGTSGLALAIPGTALLLVAAGVLAVALRRRLVLVGGGANGSGEFAFARRPSPE